MGRQFTLTKDGINLLEQIIVEEFTENPEEIRKAADALGLNLMEILQRYLKRSLEIEEDLSRIRLGMDPKYRCRDYYNSKK